MELLTGGSFADRIRKKPSEEQLVRCIEQVASALSYMHARKMQHRDLKTDNVLFDKFSAAKIIDLGLACTLQSKYRVSTKSGGAVGTLLYMSPEKGSGQGYDAKDDVWALGCMVAGGALGTPMEDMGLNMQGIFALNRTGVDQLISRAKAANATLGSLASRMLEQEPRNRPSAQQVVDSLSTVASQPQPNLSAVRQQALHERCRQAPRPAKLGAGHAPVGRVCKQDAHADAELEGGLDRAALATPARRWCGASGKQQHRPRGWLELRRRGP